MNRLLIVALGGLLGLAGCSGDKDSADQTGPTGEILDQMAVERGQALFMENCNRCHPRSGRGDYLKRIPATLLTRRTQQELMNWIEGAGQHREMPSFTQLSDEERAALAQYLMQEVSQ